MRLLDTDTCIELLRGNRMVIDRRGAVDDEVATTWITAAELYFGAARSSSPQRNHELVTDFLATLHVFGLDLLSAQVFGEAKAMLRRRGMPLPDADIFIASMAISRGATVVTGNRVHFERIPGLVLEDWIRP